MRNEEIKKIKENILNPLLWEYVYLIILSFFLLFYSLYTVQYPANWPQPTFSYLRTALFVYVFLKYTFMNKECLTMNEIALIFILLCSFLTSYQNTGYIELLDTCLLYTSGRRERGNAPDVRRGGQTGPCLLYTSEPYHCRGRRRCVEASF